MASWHRVLYGWKENTDPSNIKHHDLAGNPTQGKFLRFSSGSLEWAGIDAGGEVSMSRIALGGENSSTGTFAPVGYRYDNTLPNIRTCKIASVTVDTPGANLLFCSINFINTQGYVRPDAPIVHRTPSMTGNITNGELTSFTFTDYGSFSDIPKYSLSIYPAEATPPTITIDFDTPVLMDEFNVYVDNEVSDAHEFDIIWGKPMDGSETSLSSLRCGVHSMTDGDILLVNDNSSQFKGVYIIDTITIGSLF